MLEKAESVQSEEAVDIARPRASAIKLLLGASFAAIFLDQGAYNSGLTAAERACGEGSWFV